MTQLATSPFVAVEDSNGLSSKPHNTNGFPSFEGWPTYKDKMHQQMYYKWLERAYKGGLRLIHIAWGSNR